MRLSIFPRPKRHNAPHMSAADVKTFCDSGIGQSGLMKPANFKHRSLFYSGQMTALSLSVSSFFNRIINIIRVSAWKQMARITARRVIASMANIQRIRSGFAVRQFKCLAVGLHCFSRFTIFKPSVSLAAFTFFPRPTFIGFTHLNFIPKKLRHGSLASPVFPIVCFVGTDTGSLPSCSLTVCISCSNLLSHILVALDRRSNGTRAFLTYPLRTHIQS